MSVTTCNESLIVKTSDVNFVCVTCGKCVLNDNHDLCVLHYINGVNSITKKPIVVPISTREPKRTVNQSIATPHRSTIASESTIHKSRSTSRKPYEHGSKTCSWWYPKLTPPGYKWEPKSKTGNCKHKCTVYYVEGLNHNLFSVGQCCDADLEVAFQKSSCHVRDLKGNDLLTGSRGTNLYSITSSRINFPNPNLLNG
ncbi:hypothetical protein Tco_1156820 [Tanacetum coccineum]